MTSCTWLSAVIFVAAISVSEQVRSEEGSEAAHNTSQLIWNALPELPPARGQATQIGVAGPFVGIHNDALIVAGGANFPHGVPWDDGEPNEAHAGMKIYWDDIFVLTKELNGAETNFKWQSSPGKLATPVGYGVSISTPSGIICIGGESKPLSQDEDGNTTQTLKIHDDVFVLRWNPQTKSVEVDDRLPAADDTNQKSAPLPKLPEPTTMLCGALVGSVIYVAGGDSGSGATSHFWALDLEQRNSDHFQWHALPAWPGPPRILAIAAAQSDGAEDCFYLFSGRHTRPGQDSELLVDAYRFRPSTNDWQRLSDSPRCLMAGTALAGGAHHVLVFGGDAGHIFQRLEQLGRENNRESLAEIRDIQSTHPGFNRDIVAYHTVTDTWTTLPDLLPEGGSHVTTTAVRWNDRVVIPTGEVRPGIRSAKVWQAEVRRVSTFGWLNYTVLVLYLAALVLLGLYFAQRMESTDDFFKAGQRIPWWAAGISIFGTQLSAITFMAIPAKTYATDWRLIIGNLMIVAAAPVVVFCFLPFYRRLNVTTAYEYLELRFNRPTRLLASGMFILMQFGRIGIVLLLPSIALSVVTGIDIKICILTMGLLCIIYTVLGGIEAVIWTDVLQVFVLVGGGLLCLALIPRSIEGGWNEMINIGERANRFRLLDLHWNWAEPTFFVMFFGAFAQNLISYGSDQVVIQRYLTTRDEATARRAIWTAAIMAMPATLLFFLIGTALYAYFKTHPAELDPTLAQPDAIFPHYIVSCLPAGAAGLVIAAIFAAAMSSLDSSMNSVAAAFTNDFYRRPGRREMRGELWIARIVTVLVGLCGTLFAIWMGNQPDIKSLWDQFAAYLGLFGGGLCGIFLLAIFTQRTSGAAALIALVASGLIQYLIRGGGVVNPWLYSATGIVACFVSGYLLSFVLPQRNSLSGLTLATLNAEARIS